MSIFEPGLPSIRLIQSYIKNKEQVEIGLMTNNILKGQILWQDHNAICLLDQHQNKTLIWLQSIAYMKGETKTS